MKWIHDKSDVPAGPHFAILEFSSYYVEGDERSRTNPGHGYPGHSESKCEYILFENEEEWKKEITKRSGQISNHSWVAIKATPATVKTNVVVSVE